MIDMEMTSKKIIEVLFNLIIVILFDHPLFLILYTQLSGIDLQNLIAMNTYCYIMFIKSFIYPYIVIYFAHRFYLILYTQLSGIDLQNLIAMNPYLNIMYIKSFISPFIGFYVLQLKEKLIKDRKVETIILQLILLANGLFILENATFSVSIFILSFYLCYHWKIKISDLFQYFKKKYYSSKNYLISIGLLLMAVTIRIMIKFVSNI